MGEPSFDLEAILDETVQFMKVSPEGEGWVGMAPDWFGEYLFGGFVVGQAVYAATRTAPDGRRIHSLHAYFLRPVAAGKPVSYRISTLRDGRSFALRHLEVVQDDALVLTMDCSFTADTEGYEYELPVMSPGVPQPDELESEPGPGPWIAAYLGPTPPADDGTMTSTHRAWFKIGAKLDDDPHLHSALLAFATDWTGTGGRPLDLEGDMNGMISLDHAAWFHRPARADDWLFYDVHSLVNTGGRGLLRGTMHGLDGRLLISVAQEMLLRPLKG